MWATSLLTMMLLFPLLSAAPLDIAGGVEGDNAGLHGHDENVTRRGKYFVHNQFDFSVSVQGDVGSIGHEVNIVQTRTLANLIECKEGLSVLFKSIDSNKNGLMDPKELLSVCHQNNIQITESVAVRILTLPDKTVGFNIAKFCELLKNCPSTNSADILYFLLQLYDKVTVEEQREFSPPRPQPKVTVEEQPEFSPPRPQPKVTVQEQREFSPPRPQPKGKPNGCYMKGECNNKKQDWSVEKRDTWGCANLNSCTDKDACEGRPQKLFEFCDNNEDQPFISRFIKDGQEITFRYPPVLPRQRNIALGYPNCDAGWYDVQGQGVKNDYCRWVGDCGCRGDCSFWSCALAGSNVDKSPKGQYTEPGKSNGCYMKGECNNNKQDWSVEKRDTWGCANLNSCTDKDACEGRPKKLFEFCENNEDQPFMSRFIKDGLEITIVYPEVEDCSEDVLLRVCSCPRLNSPVCADGEIYGNLCIYQCAKKKTTCEGQLDFPELEECNF